jgi:transposase
VPALPSSVLEPLWVQIAALLPTRPDTHPLGCHRPRIADRVVFDKLIQVLVFGCGDRRIADATCSATTLRRRRDAWISAGVVEQLRLVVLAADDRLFGLELEQLAVDGCITKAPCGGQVAGPSPTDRRKQGRKRSVAVEAGGIPLAMLPAPANQRHDGLLAATLDAIAAVGVLPARPVVHLDAGYDWKPCRQVLVDRGMTGQIATPGAADTDPGGPPVGDRAYPCGGQPGRQAALVHPAPPAGGGVLAGVGQRRHRRWPAAPPRLDPLPLQAPTKPTIVTLLARRFSVSTPGVRRRRGVLRGA